MLIHFSVTISRLSDQNTMLAQRLALLQQRVEQEAEGGALGGQRRRGSGRRPARGMTVSAAIVCYDEELEQVREAIERLLDQARPPEEILVVDNDPGGRLAGSWGSGRR